jgi:hypothetical protein
VEIIEKEREKQTEYEKIKEKANGEQQKREKWS